MNYFQQFDFSISDRLKGNVDFIFSCNPQKSGTSRVCTWGSCSPTPPVCAKIELLPIDNDGEKKKVTKNINYFKFLEN